MKSCPPGEQEAVDARVIHELHANRCDPETGILELSPGQAHALKWVAAYWDEQLGAGNPRYGFLKDTVLTGEERKAVASFFFWTA